MRTISIILISCILIGVSFIAGWKIADHRGLESFKSNRDYETKMAVFVHMKGALDSLNAIHRKGAENYAKSLETLVYQNIQMLENLPLGDERDEAWLEEFHDGLVSIGKTPPEWLRQRVGKKLETGK